MNTDRGSGTAAASTWFNPGVRSIGLASFLSDVGHEIPTSLLPSFLTVTLGAPASALGLVEGIADGAAGVAKLAGGALADDPARRAKVAVGGYVTTAVLSSGVGLATAPWQVAVLRTGAWAARGVRGPSRNAILADVVPAEAYGRAYGFERMADNLGAIVGPLLAIPLIAVMGVRSAIVVNFMGAGPADASAAGSTPASTFEEAALAAAALATGAATARPSDPGPDESAALSEAASRLRPGQSAVRGLFSGGSLAGEAKLILKAAHVARAQGATWSQVAEALNRTRQAVEQRFG